MNDAVDIRLLSAAHGRAGSSCGVPALDRSFKEQAAPDTRRGVANCLVAARSGGTMLGDFGLSASSAVLVAAKDDRAEAFCARNGFRNFATVARRLHLPLGIAVVASGRATTLPHPAPNGGPHG